MHLLMSTHISQHQMLCCFQRGPFRSCFLVRLGGVFRFFFPDPPDVFLQSSVVESRVERDLGKEMFSSVQLPHIRSYSVRVIPDRYLPHLPLQNSSDGAVTVSLGNLLQRFAVPVIKKGFLISNLQLKATISRTSPHQADLTAEPAPPSHLQLPH